MIHNDRLRHLVGAPPGSDGYVLYWMQQAQRTRENPALIYALEKAGELGLPLVVGFVLTPDFPEANLRHYTFMAQGLAEVQKALDRTGIAFVLKTGDVIKSVSSMAEEAAWAVFDVGYLRVQREWRTRLSRLLKCPITLVETDAVVPVQTASAVQESAARTIRPKLLKHVETFVRPLPAPADHRKGKPPPIRPADPIDPARLAARAAAGKSGPGPVPGIRGGQDEARARLDAFIRNKLSDYPGRARDPAADCRSGLSPYLHFGQISPVEIVRAVRDAEVPGAAKEAFIEQVVVRRELAINFAWYNDGYDRFERAVPPWAQQSLAAHQKDPRPYLYTEKQLEAALTHDPYWNAAQAEMVRTGTMHNYMRMYWGKKIIEWTPDPAKAFEIMLRLNNRYELDGRDPNGFAGVAWCFGQHDRPFAERSVFGKVRYMNAAGLKRKFDIEAYVKRHSGPA